MRNVWFIAILVCLIGVAGPAFAQDDTTDTPADAAGEDADTDADDADDDDADDAADDDADDTADDDADTAGDDADDDDADDAADDDADDTADDDADAAGDDADDVEEPDDDDDEDDPTGMIPEEKPDSNKEDPPALNREGEDAQEARKAAMKALAGKNPPKDGGFQPVPVPNNPPPAPKQAAEVFPRLENHGYFRFRADLFYNMDLDTKGTSPVPPPLDSKDRGELAQPNIEPTDAETLAGANIRFRWSPIFHITEDLRVFATFDILDNLVMGSTPDGLRSGRIDVPILAFTGGTEEPRTDTIGKDSVIVRSAFAEVKTIFGVLRAGRMPSNWGLGILANGGGSHSKVREQLGEDAWDCLDCNHGDFVDRIMFLTKEPFTRAFYIVFAWDFVSEGLTGYNAQNDSYGQAFDLAQADDVTQFVLAVFSRPLVKQEVDERKRDFDELRKPVFDWGVYFVYREQDADLSSRPTKSGFVGNSTNADLTIRGAQAFIPDVWLRFAYKFGFKQHVKLELEAAGIFGTIDQATESAGSSRDLMQIGTAFESEVRIEDVFFGLNAGFATGKDSLGFGYQDILATGDPNTTNQVISDVNNFRFDRNYYVDLIMFRELVGGVTNAIYFDLWAEYIFPISTAQSFNNFGARLDLITAVAPKPESTPGGESWYGFESDLVVFYEEVNRFRVEVAGGLFVPGGVWTRKPNRNYPILPTSTVYQDDQTISEALEGGLAWTIQSNFWWMF